MEEKSQKLSIGLLYDDSLDSSDGVAHQVKELGSWLSARGHRVVYLCGQSNTKEWSGGKVYSLARNIKVAFNNNRLSIPLISRSREIRSMLDTEKLDVIHVQMPYSPLMAQRVISRAYKTTAIVGTFHIFPASHLVSIGSRILRLIQIRSLKKIQPIIAVSSAAQQFAKRAFGIDTVVIPNMVDINKLNYSGSQKSDTQKIVFLGRLVDRKGCKQLLEAAALLIKQNSEFNSIQIIIGGRGPKETQLKVLAKTLGIEDKVEFKGFIKDKDKSEFLAQADIACFPSLYGESFGIVLIEAMAAGAKVVLGGANPGYASVLGDQQELLIDPDNTQMFADRLKKLLTDQSTISKLNSWQVGAVKQYDVNVVGAKIETIYHLAIANKANNKA